MFKHILLATDGSASSEHASRMAVDLARTHGAKLTALYVADPYPYIGIGELNPAGLQAYAAAGQQLAAQAHAHVDALCREGSVVALDVRLVEDVTAVSGIVQTAETLAAAGFDEVVLATGIVPRDIGLAGSEHAKVLSYLDVLRDHKAVGKHVAIIGAGGIGFDVAEYLTEPHSLTLQPEAWLKDWGIDKGYQARGALLPDQPTQLSERKVYLLQRKTSKVGAGLGKTTGWIHRASLKKKGVEMIAGVNYVKVDDNGLWVEIAGEERCLNVDNVIICAGQEPLRDLVSGLQQHGITPHLIGGADVAAELDAKRAIRQGAELAAAI